MIKVVGIKNTDCTVLYTLYVIEQKGKTLALLHPFSLPS